MAARAPAPNPVHHAVQAGLRHQLAGDSGAAEACYRGALARQPREPDALHLLGQVLHLRGQHAAALGFVEEAIRVAPRAARFHATRGVVLRALDRGTEAEGAFRAAVVRDPRYAYAHRNLGAVLARRGACAEAAECFKRAVALEPADAEAWNDLAAALWGAGDTPAALRAGARAFAIAPAAPAVILGYGRMLAEMGRTDEILPALRARLAAASADPDLLAAIGAVFSRAAGAAEAAECFARAVALRPADRGLRLLHAACLTDVGRPAEAAALFEALLAEARDDASAWLGLGTARRHLGDLDAATFAYDRAGAIDPASAEAPYNRGCVSMLRGEEEAALSEFDAALRLDAVHWPAHRNRAISLLRVGRFGAAWDEYRWRDGPRADLPQARWPNDLAGREVHVLPEQGVGDHLFHLRYVKLIAARGARITSDPDPRLRAMLQRAGLTIAKTGSARALVARMGDLPWLLGQRDDDAPPPPLALTPLPDAMTRAAALLAAAPRPWVAVGWRAGGKKGVQDTIKEIDVGVLGRALAPLAGGIVSVQRQPNPGEAEALAAALGRPVLDLAAANDDLELMLALMAQVDAYVTVSNTNVHLRFGVGLPAHVLIPHPIDWRWRVEAGGRASWYPAARALLQAPGGDWSRALAVLGADLAGAPAGP